jgi:hypothetical protein
MLRDGGGGGGGGGGGETGSDSIEQNELDGDEDESSGDAAGYGPATKVSELLLDMMCNSKEETTKEETKEEREERLKSNQHPHADDGDEKIPSSDEIPNVPDCLLMEKNVVLDDDFTKMHAGKIFKQRNSEEAKLSLSGEGRMCTPQDIIDAAKILRMMGSHIVIGVHVGGEISSSVDLSTEKPKHPRESKIEKNGGLMDIKIKKTLGNLMKKARHEHERQKKEGGHSKTYPSTVLRSQSVRTWW